MTDKSKKHTVWILQTGEPLHIDEGNPRPMRAMNLANALVAAGHKVVLWSSAFYHQEKRQRSLKAERIEVAENLEIRLIPSPGYSRNIGPGRLWDHAVMAKNLSKLLKEEKNGPNIAFLGYPPIETAAIMAKWLTKKNIPYMVDVKDQWPSIFVEAMPGPLQPLGKIAFSPYFYLGRKAMKSAMGLSAMSAGFVGWAATFAGRTVNDNDRIVPLTTQINNIPDEEFAEANAWWDKLGILDDGTPRVCFIGSHSRAFDMEPVMVAAKAMAASGTKCQFVICGDGPVSGTWKELAQGLDHVYFPGWIDRAKGEALGKRSIAALGPYHNVDNFILNMPNKIIDSLAQGMPILSPLKGEVHNLITKFNVGLSYGEDTGKKLEDCILRLINEPDFKKQLAENSKTLYQKEYAYDKVYGGLVDHLVYLADKK